MRYRIFYKIGAIILAIFFFLSTISLTIDMHFCKGKINNVNLIGKAKSCHEQNVDSTTHGCQILESNCHNISKSNTQIACDGCCENKTIVTEKVENFIISQQFKIEDLNITLIAFVEDLCFSNESKDSQFLKYKNHIPPILYKNMPIFIQSFLL